MPPPPDDGPPSPNADRAARVREVAALFVRLGFTAFGGPAAHVALMEDEVVNRRRWLDREKFLDLVGLVNFIPGPNSTELAIQLGLIRAGRAGLVVAGACFILPAVLIILPLAWAYEHYGGLPRIAGVLASVNAALIAVLGVACWRFARTSVKDVFTAVVAVLAAAAAALAHWRHVPQSELIILAAAVMAGAARQARIRAGTLLALPAPTVMASAFAAAAPAAPTHWLARLTLFFLQVGATLFGSGYVLVSYLQAGLVDQRGWLTERQLLDAVAVGQVTPGPLLTTATFVGYVVGRRESGSDVGGVVGALAATAAIFLPAFVLVALLGHSLPRLRDKSWARGALDATNAAVAALVLVVTVTLASTTLRGPAPVAIAVGAAAALALRLNATWVMLAAAATGFARGWFT